jgi:uncharacterized protein YndB with AHSA1/START domain
MSTDTMTTTQVYQVFIRASAQQIWEAITTPEWTERYGYGGVAQYDLRPGGSARQATSDAMKQAGAAKGFPVPDLAVEGEFIEVDPPRRLVQTWQMVMDSRSRTSWRASRSSSCSCRDRWARWPAAAGRGSSATSRPFWKAAAR